jgi:hypothetical protein
MKRDLITNLVVIAVWCLVVYWVWLTLIDLV